MLCQSCQDMVAQALNRDEHVCRAGRSGGYIHHETKESLQNSAQTGCYICNSLWYHYTVTPELEIQSVAGQFSTFSIFQPDSSNYESKALGIYFGMHFDRLEHTFMFSLKRAQEIHDARIPIGDNTGSHNGWTLVEQWFWNCIISHARCSRLRSRTYTPTRLLDLGPSGIDRPPRLCLASECLEGVPYITLSHCWGKVDPLKLLRCNIDAMRKSIDFAELPKTFQDAVTIVRKLGFRYLWIDSLCIIQDSLHDWRSEAARMADVYKNSICNIAATGAIDCTERCFFSRSASTIQPCLIRLPGHNPYLVTDQELVQELENSPLNRRAWVLQERFLAPRVLNWGKRQLFWECREHLACEIYPHGILRTPSAKNRFSEVKRSTISTNLRPLSQAAEADKIPSLQHSWTSIVEVYSRANLTFASDKLLALSGVATEFQRVIADDYLAGLWRPDLLNQLQWFVMPGPSGTCGLKAPTYRAPSWSWASVDGDIQFPGPRESPTAMATILDARVSTVDENKTGQVSHGLLRVHGTLIELEKYESSTNYGSILAGQKIGLKFDTQEGRNIQPPADRIFCLPVSFHNQDTVSGLLLRSCDDEANRGKYRRIGYFFTRWVNHDLLERQPKGTFEIV